MDFKFSKSHLYRLSAFIIGALMPLSYAPYHYYILAILIITILFYLWTLASTARESFIIGYLFGLGFFGVGVNWLHISINLFGGVNLYGAIFFTYCLVAFISVYPALCGYLARRFFNKYHMLSLAPLWLVTEWCRGWFLTGFPWLNLGTSQTDSPLSVYAPLLGDYGISFIICLIAVSVLQFINGTKKSRIVSTSVLVILCLTPLFIDNISWTREKTERLNVALIQGAIPQELKWKTESRQKTYDIYSTLSDTYWSGDLIIWPETAIPSLYHLADDFIDNIKNRMQDENAMFMSGIAYKNLDSNKYFNSVLLIDDKDRFYHKHHLVPFGEYLPLEPILGAFLHFLKIPMSDFSSGKFDEKLFSTDKGIFGMSICYEDAYATEIRQSLPTANILINVSNDAWFGDSLAPHQHLQIARMRALESGRYMLRATNTGISAIIDETGQIVTQSPQFEPHALSGEVKLFEGNTPFSFYGNYVVLFISLIILLITYYLQRRIKN
ncbi:MAG: apolipoprotein N-acyltransferase [Proteobacteria bacterium]|nr:apolipoprotein N-acyltransferase [Pseudomonadota bacterium]